LKNRFLIPLLIGATFTSATASAQSVPAAQGPVINGLLQFWMNATSGTARSAYRIRRAEVKASGDVMSGLKWVVVLDFAKSLSMSSGTTTIAQSSRALQDAMLSYQAGPSLRIDLGQQKIPLSLEGSQSSSSLETVDRALFASDRARGGTFGDIRDVGIGLRGKWTGALDYQAGLFNGSGESQNDTDLNTAKALIGRLVVRPWSALQLGVSGVYAGKSAGDAPRRDREAVEVRLRTSKVLVQGELAAGHDGALSRAGAYAHAGYRVTPSLDLHARMDAWDPDRDREADAASVTERDYLAGITWTVPATAFKAQADLLHRTYSSSLVPSRWQVLVNLQTSW
jgi:hypothetical protein